MVNAFKARFMQYSFKFNKKTSFFGSRLFEDGIDSFTSHFVPQNPYADIKLSVVCLVMLIPDRKFFFSKSNRVRVGMGNSEYRIRRI